MTHPSEEQFIWYYYGEAEDPAAISEHLAACDSCRAAHAALERVLASVDSMPAPEPPESYGAEVWQRIQPRLAPNRSLTALSLLHRLKACATSGTALQAVRRWALAAAVAALVVAAFLAGRFWPRPAMQALQPIPEQVRERILLVAVGDHLDRSQMILVELANASPDRKLNISSEQRWASELVDDNRLYRQTAARSGDVAIADMLDELERVLLEIAHGPSELSAAELRKIQRRIESEGILFKLRVIGSKVRQQEQRPANGL